METPTQHWKKAQVATELFGKEHLPADYADTLDLLNDARRTAVYEGDEPNLGDASLADLLVDVEAAVDIAERAST